MRVLLAVLLAAALALPAVGSALSEEEISDIALASYAIVFVRSKLGEGLCSGTFIREDLVLTAAHCFGLDETPRVEVVWYAGNGRSVLSGSVLATSRERDLALVRTSPAKARAATVADAYRVGTRVVMASSPVGEHGFVSFGRVAKLSVLSFNDGWGAANQKYLYLDLMGAPGSSGAGVLSYEGALLGVYVRSGIYMSDNAPYYSYRVFGLAVAGEEVQKWLSGVRLP